MRSELQRCFFSARAKKIFCGAHEKFPEPFFEINNINIFVLIK
jgi:hypothetical protein